MVAYYLQMQPHLFRSAVETEFHKLKEQRDAEAEQEGNEEKEKAAAEATGSDLVLYRRMAEVRRAEQRHALEDLMYVCILERFQEIGVNMLPALEPVEENVAMLKALTEGVHSQEALAMVKEHVLSILGPASMAYANTLVKMSKLQAAQVYAASIMFGYFLRRVDKRFQLARTLGMLPETPEDAVARLERLLSMVDSEGSDPDTPPAVSEATNPDLSQPEPGSGTSGASSSSGSAEQAQQQPQQQLVKRPKSALRQYVESFDQATLVQTARLVSVEGASLVERQTKALFGDVRDLQSQMQSAVGQDAASMEELMQRVQQARRASLATGALAVADGTVESVTMTIGTQRRAVLEAVAYGCFLRDVESQVDTDYALLTPLPATAGQG
ncbi:hypothetical protein N2152v2_005264 [Parachlorella kessleri]